MPATEKDPVTWAWKPVGTFEIDLDIGGKRLVTRIDASQRNEVAMGLARLADAVMGDPRSLFWRWDDGAEQNLDGETVLDHDIPQQTIDEASGRWRFAARVVAHGAVDGELLIRQHDGCDSLPMIDDVVDVVVLVDRSEASDA